MKRKIAILLSAMMVASAMPMTASAVQLKGNTDINAGFPKADQTIDTNYNFKGKIKYDARGNFLDSNGDIIDPSTISITSSDLRDRYSVLRLNLENGGTSGDIKAGTTFKLNLENGTFDEDLEHYFDYIQTSNGKLVTSEEAMKNSANSLTDVFTNVANANAESKQTSGWKSVASGAGGTINLKSTTNVTGYKEGVVTQFKRAQLIAGVANESGNQNKWVDFSVAINGTQTNSAVTGLKLVPGTENYAIRINTQQDSNDNTFGANTTLYIAEKVDGGYNKIAEMKTDTSNTETATMQVFNAINGTQFYTEDGIKLEMQNEFKQEMSVSSTNLDLPHIPYDFSIESEKTATVTIPVDVKESDREVTLKSASYTFDDLKNTHIHQNAGASTPDFSLNSILGIEELTVGGATLKETSSTVNPYLAIPLGAVIADSDAPVKVSVDGGYSQKIIDGTYTITKGSVEGSTSIKFPDSSIRTFDEDVILEPVVVRENTKNTMGKSNELDSLEFVVRLDGGFKFADMDSIIANPQNYVVDDSGNLLPFAHNSTGTAQNPNSTVSIVATELNDSAIKFTLKNFKEKNQNGNYRNNAVGLRFKDIKVEPTNDKNYGDVTFTISGDGISTQSKVVARRNELGFKLETTKDPQEMIVGRHYGANNYGLVSNNSGVFTATTTTTTGTTISTLDGASMLEKDNTTVEIKFSESIPNTLVEARQLDFIVPDGVKIVDAKIYDTKNIKSQGAFEDRFEIVNNGKTLRLKSAKGGEYSVIDKKKIAEFKMTLDLSIDPAFTGDIKLGVTGGGQGEVVETVVAKAKAPFELKTQTTKANMGYQDYNTADIVITETQPGMFLENRTATLSLVAPYGTSELGFSEAKYEVSGGELEIKERDFKVGKYTNGGTTTDGVISFRIDKASHKNPSTVTIKNVKVGTTRSVPFGSYSLALSGDAVLNNYNGNTRDSEKFPIYNKSVGDVNSTELANLYMQNNTSYFEFKDYVNVITETGTLDHTVKITVGEKTVLIGDQAIDMDVAPYIQASSNSTMVPLRFVSVALGVDTASVTNPDASNKIAYDANTKTATIYYGAGTGQKIIQFQAGSNIMTVDGTRIPMEYGVKAEIKDNRMFVPFRALGQALGVNVSWDADTRTAIYNENDARNANVTSTTAATTTESTTESTTASTTTESTTASDSTTESTTAKK